MIFIIKIYILTFCFFTCARSEIIWPINTEKKLSSNYGEFRDNHFHMGIDIKTNEKEGYEIYAVGKGYISRMVTNYKGYGKALYLKTITGNTAVYCHLSKFIPELEKALTLQQKINNSYHVDKYFYNSDYPFDSGDIIGFSGNTGASFGPHLHFELRDSNDITLNPLKHGLEQPDNIPPIIKGLTIFPLHQNTIINGFPLPIEIFLTKINNKQYSIPKVITCSGTKIGFAISAEDRMEKQTNRFQFYKTELFIDDSLMYSFIYDSISFEETKQVKLIENKIFGKANGLIYQKLYLNNNSHSEYEKYNSGQIGLPIGKHTIQISLTDNFGNTSEIFGEINWEPLDKNFKLNSRQWVNMELKKNELYSLDRFQILNSENGVFLEYQNSNKIKNVRSTLLNEKFSKQFDLYFSPPKTYYSGLIPFISFKNIKEVEISSNNYSEKFQIFSKVVYPNTKSELKSKDEKILLEIPEFSVYDTAMIWIEKLNTLKVDNFISLADYYKINPDNIPLVSSVNIKFDLNENQANMNGLGIYKLNQKKWKWEYQSTKYLLPNYITSDLNKLGIVTLLQDTIPPTITPKFPMDSESYKYSEIDFIYCFLDDNLSGIMLEEGGLHIILDGISIFPEYQPILKKLSYSINKPLTVGNHIIQYSAKDYAGNISQKTINFNVN